jgi:hypothetical protein
VFGPTVFSDGQRRGGVAGAPLGRGQLVGPEGWTARGHGSGRRQKLRIGFGDGATD